MRVEELKKVAVLGAGVMGYGIAMTVARNGFEVVIVDVSNDIVEQAYLQIKEGPFGLMRLVQKGEMTKDEVDDIIGRIKSTTDSGQAAKDTDLVIEAVSEDPELKKKVWKLYDGLCPERTIFASNTSTIMITELASATKRPDRFIGTHWFNPPQVMKLIEVVRGVLTSDETCKFTLDFCRRIRKNPVEVNDVPGFFTSRFMCVLMMSAIRMFDGGIAGIKEIDTMCKQGFGFPMGPFEIMDLTGLDVPLHAADYIYPLTGDPTDQAPVTLRKLVTAGYLGHKQGSKGGWYDYYRVSK